jgi:hypothetical protein
MTAAASRPQWASRVIVVATGAIVGFFLWRTYFADISHLYAVEFARGQWLVATDKAPQGYFRKELYLSGSVRQAWVQVAATDSFILYVNGKAVDGKGYASLNVSGIYDIGDILAPGKNVLGVVARRLSYPGPAMAVLEGAFVDDTGREHVFATDLTWKVSPVEQWQGDGEILWYAEPFDATSWATANTAGRPEPSEVYPLGVHPLAFTMPPQGKWIRHVESSPGWATFSYTLMFPSRIEDGWIRIASEKPYSLAINGITVAGGETPRDIEVMRLLRFQGTPMWHGKDGLSTDLYRIAPLLGVGINRISVSSEQRIPSLPGLFVDGFVVSRGDVRTFGSNATWTVTPPHLLTNHAPRQREANLSASEVSLEDPLPGKQAMTAVLPLTYEADRLGKASVIVLLTVGSVYLLWMGTCRILRAFCPGNPVEIGCLAALTHFPTLLTLGSLFLLSFDVRFDPTFPFQSWVIGLSVGSLLGCKLVVALGVWYHKKRGSQMCQPASPRLGAILNICPVLLLGALIAIGGWSRLHNLDAQSLYHDEVHMVNYVQGLLKKGYPHKMIGPIEIPLATYELAPYPIALSVMLLGFSDVALRLPAALFGTMTIPLIYFVGKRVFDRRVGLLSATIYAFCPQALIWSQYLWHPQQTQFFALLTSYLFYEAIRSSPIAPRYLYPAAVAFVATYLSWEGSGFLLPALGLGLAVVKGRDVTWLRDKHLWIAVTFVSLAVALQLIRRLLLQIPYLVIGQGLSDVSVPMLFFLDPMYDPIFYIKNFLWLENNALLTLLVLGAIPFLFRKNVFSYYCILLFSVIAMMTNLLSNAAIRYVYYIQTFLILLASSVTISIYDISMGITSRLRQKHIIFVKVISMMILTFGIILMSSTFMKLYRLNDFSYPTGVHTRDDVYYIDYRSSSEYVKYHYHEDDLVVAVVPNALSYYASLESQYFVQTYTMRQVFYDPSELSQRYLERIVGNPVIRTFDELQSIMSNYRRVWLITVPYSIFLRLSGPEIVKYVQKEGKVVYESYNARIYLLKS